MERVVITGAAGTIGRLLTKELASDYELTLIDRAWRSGALHRRQDIRRLGYSQRAFAGAQTVIDLAADARANLPWRGMTSENVPATLASLEAARRAGVRRVIFASSNHITGLYERDEPYRSICAGHYEGLDPKAIPLITSSDPIRPDGPYGVGKALGEAAARFYAEEYGLSVICLRIGTVYADDRPKSPRGFATIISHRDFAQLVRACLTAPAEIHFAILYGVSNNTWRFWDISEAARLVGYAPVDDAERWRPVDDAR
jgi:nucleoside-diphosphate-sugar epimerase